MSAELLVQIDGACAPINPGGTASWGCIVYRVGKTSDASDSLETLWEGCGEVGSGPEMSNNVGEYVALISFLKWLMTYLDSADKAGRVVVESDSQLLVNQITGKWKTRGGLYYSYYLEAMERLERLRLFWGESVVLAFRWIPREQNEADRLAKRRRVS